MDMETLREYCLQKPGADESFPFGEETLVFKVGGKIFLLASLTEGNRFNAKCDPDRAVELRERHEEVQPGYHMNKRHWNTVRMDGGLKAKEIREMIDHSYEIVIAGAAKKGEGGDQADLAHFDLIEVLPVVGFSGQRYHFPGVSLNDVFV